MGRDGMSGEVSVVGGGSNESHRLCVYPYSSWLVMTLGVRRQDEGEVR